MKRAIAAIAIALVLVSNVATLAWWWTHLSSERYLSGETEVLFEARRAHAHLPLYVDPVVGAFDYGAVPSRYYVTYPPLWSSLLGATGLFAAPAARAISLACWAAALLWGVAFARREGRASAAFGAAFLLGTWALMQFAGSARPDALAVLLAVVGASRAIRLGRLDALSAACLALAPWVKPTVLGAVAGCLLGQASVARASYAGRGALGRGYLSRGFASMGFLKPFAVVALVSALVAGALASASHGHFLTHLARATSAPLTLAHLWEMLAARGPFFLPLIAVAGACVWPERHTPGGRIALRALAVSTAWTLLSLAKGGAASNYWMEPCALAIVTIGLFSRPFGAPRAWLALGVSAWVAVASVRGATDNASLDRDYAARLSDIRAACSPSPVRVVMSDDPALELALDGRVVDHAQQLFPLAFDPVVSSAWAADLARPEVACFVDRTGIPTVVPALSSVLRERFHAVRAEMWWLVLARN